MIDGEKIVDGMCAAMCDAIGESYEKARPGVKVSIRADARKLIMALGLRGLMVITGDHYGQIVQGHGAVLPLRGGGTEGATDPVDAPVLRDGAPGHGAHGVRNQSPEGGDG